MAKRKPKKKAESPEQKSLVPISRGQQCTARVKTCTNPECRYKYKAGDKSWLCPKCHEHRRCKAKAQHPYVVCRMHGAGGGRPPLSGKFIPPAQIADAYNAVYKDPSLLSLSLNIALSEARTSDLLNMIDDNDIRAMAGEISLALNSVLNAIYSAEAEMNRGNTPRFQIKEIKDSADAIMEMLQPAVVEEKIWHKVNEQLEITRRLNDTERKWIDQHDQMVPMSQVLEAISVIMRKALIFIPNAQDRSAFAKEMRALSPRIS